MSFSEKFRVAWALILRCYSACAFCLIIVSSKLLNLSTFHFNYIHTYKFETNDKTDWPPLVRQSPTITYTFHTSAALPTPPAQGTIFKVKAQATRHFKGPGWRPQAVVLGLWFAEAWAETWKIGPWAGGGGLRAPKRKNKVVSLIFQKKIEQRFRVPPGIGFPTVISTAFSQAEKAV